MISIPPIRLIVLSGLLAGLLAGCGTTQDHRIRVYPRDFRALEEDTQQMIRTGRIEKGFTSRMVYMALGNPARVEQPDGDAGESFTWVYKGRIQTESGEEDRFKTTNDFIWGSPFVRQAYDRLRVEFLQNEVVTIQTIPRPE